MLIRSFFSDATDGKFMKKGSFHFSESSSISAIIKTLGLYHDEQPLKHDNYLLMMENRKWRSSFIDCFSTNMIAIVYRYVIKNLSIIKLLMMLYNIGIFRRAVYLF